MNAPRKAHLTPEENRAWEFALTYYLNEDYSEDDADGLAWRDLQAEFPRLREYEGAS